MLMMTILINVRDVEIFRCILMVIQVHAVCVSMFVSILMEPMKVAIVYLAGRI